jgi:hypothetical protein
MGPMPRTSSSLPHAVRGPRVLALMAAGLLLAACAGPTATPAPDSAASCVPVVAYDDWLYRLEPVSTPLVLVEEVPGAANPDCADTGGPTAADEPVQAWRVEGYGDDYLATGTGEYDLYKRWKQR